MGASTRKVSALCQGSCMGQMCRKNVEQVLTMQTDLSFQSWLWLTKHHVVDWRVKHQRPKLTPTGTRFSKDAKETWGARRSDFHKPSSALGGYGKFQGAKISSSSENESDLDLALRNTAQSPLLSFPRVCTSRSFTQMRLSRTSKQLPMSRKTHTSGTNRTTPSAVRGLYRPLQPTSPPRLG